jgi:hypothetical protein
MRAIVLKCALLCAAVGALAAVAAGQILPCAGFTQGLNGSLHGFVPFTPDSPWNMNIASAPQDPDSGTILTFIGVGTHLHPDFGASLWQGSVIGIPYIVVPGNQPLVNIVLGDYVRESDAGPMPMPRNAPIQGYPNPGDNDRHVIVLDKGNCWEYDLYHAYLQQDGSWYADSAAVWDMLSNGQRPYTWTSTNAAGTAEFPGLVRYDEVASGEISHALAVTVRWTKQAFTPPATHWAATANDWRAAPMGMRLRLRASFDISGFPPDMQVILRALKSYGMIVVDNGGALFLSGAPDLHWNDAHVNLLKNLTAIDFEVVKIDPLYTPQNVPQGPSPTVRSFTATQSGGPGRPVTLSWSVDNGEYYIVSPSVGAIRGSRVTVYPTQTRVYTLLATNQFGRAAASVMVTVPQ